MFRTGKAELIPEVSEGLLKNIARNSEHLQMLRQIGGRSVIVVPMRARERTIGTIMISNGRENRRFAPEDLDVAEDLALRASLAIENATLHASEQEARRRAERSAEQVGRLQAVTAALSGALSPAAVADVLVKQGAVAIGADGGFVRLLTPDAHSLELVAAVGISKRFARSYGNLPLTSSLPGAEVFRTGTARYFDSTAAVEAASPEFAREHEATGHEAIAFVPLRLQDRAVGVMALSFANPRTFDDDDRQLLTALADQCAQALERARLYEAEREARAAAEQAIKSTTRLQVLAAELAEALTPEQVAEVVVAQGIASIGADAGALQLLSDDGTMLEVVNGQGPDRALIKGGWRRFSVDLKAADYRRPAQARAGVHRVGEGRPGELPARAGFIRTRSTSGPAYTPEPARTFRLPCPGGRSECSSSASIDRESCRRRSARSCSLSPASAHRH